MLTLGKTDVCNIFFASKRNFLYYPILLGLQFYKDCRMASVSTLPQLIKLLINLPYVNNVVGNKAKW